MLTTALLTRGPWEKDDFEYELDRELHYYENADTSYDNILCLVLSCYLSLVFSARILYSQYSQH